MADNTKIEWTEATWNPITGCSVVSPGCTNCYAMKLAGTRMKHHESRIGLTDASKAGPVWNGKVRFNEQWLDQPLRWKKPRMIFVCAHGDLFHEHVPWDWIDDVFRTMCLAPTHTFQVLTKRADRMLEYIRHIDKYLSQYEFPVWPLPNVWLGVSVEDQQRADERIPLLLQTPAAVRWLSCEPLLGPVDLGNFCRYIDWVVAGGESGKDARPMHPDWARSLRDQCQETGAPFFFKQHGEYAPVCAQYPSTPEEEEETEAASCCGDLCLDDTGYVWPDGLQPSVTGRPWLMDKVGKKAAGSLLDGVEHKEWPGGR